MKPIFYYIVFFICSLSYTQNTFFSIFDLDKSIINKIKQEQIILVETDINFGKGKHYQVYAMVNNSPENVFTAIENFDNYQYFMPRFKSAEAVELTDTLISYIFNIELHMNINYQYKIKVHKSIEESIYWLAWETIDWEKNSIKETWGQWYLQPYGNDNKQTLIHYQVYTDPGYIPLGFNWIVNILMEGSLPDTVRNLKIWVERNED